VLPAGSRACTLKEWLPSESDWYPNGDVHAAYDSVSSLHSKHEPDSLALKLKLPVEEFASVAGVVVMLVIGGVVSNVQLTLVLH